MKFLWIWKLPLKFGKEMVQIQYRFFNLAFKRIFSDVPIRRSFGHKIQKFYADVEKERKKEGKKN